MRISNTITFKGERTYLSESGNKEKFKFQIASKNFLTRNALESIAGIHGMLGQDVSFKTENRDGMYVYQGESTAYLD
jgi:hypothetical protein